MLWHAYVPSACCKRVFFVVLAVLDVRNRHGVYHRHASAIPPVDAYLCVCDVQGTSLRGTLDLALMCVTKDVFAFQVSSEAV